MSPVSVATSDLRVIAPLTDDDRQALLSLARRVIRDTLAGVREPLTQVADLPPRLQKPGASFVSGRMLAALQRRWIWLLLAAVVVGGLGFGGGYYKGRYSVTVTLTRPESGGPSPGTLKSLLQDWQLVRRVAEKSQPHIAADKLITRLAVEDEARTERIHVTLQGQDTKALVDLANLFASEAIEYSKNDQLRAPQSELPFWQEKIQKYDEEIVRAEAAFAAFQKANGKHHDE